MKLWTVFVAVALAAVQAAAVAVAALQVPVYDFRLIQGWAELPRAAVYADIAGMNDTPAKGVRPEDLKVSLGTASGRVKRLVPFEDSREGIAYVLLVDVSKSLSARQFVQMKDTLAAFVDSMSESDQAALITFGSEVKTVQAFTPDRGRLKEKLAALQPADEDTAFYGAIERGIAVARAGGDGVPRRRVAITLTDGVNDFAGGVGKDDILKQLQQDPVTLYLIGFFQGRPTPAEESAIGVMKQFSRASGGRYYDGREGSWRGIYFAISRAIRNSFLIELEFPELRSEGSVYPLEIGLTAAGRTWTDKLQLTVPAGGKPAAGNAEEKQKGGAGGSGQTANSGPTVALAGGAAAVVLAGGLWYWLRRRRSAPAAAPAATGPAADADAADGLSGAASASEATAAAVGPAGIAVRLIRLHEGRPAEQFEFEIDGCVVIGSDPARSHLVLESDSRVAPAHCELFVAAGRLYVRELETEQGTLLNGVPVTDRQPVENQDVLSLGGAEMRIAFPVEI